jgi:SAM-dependent methyltransferase
MGPFNISRPLIGGFIDRAEVEHCGIIRLIGWSEGGINVNIFPKVQLDGKPVPFLQYYRFRRRDVSSGGTGVPAQFGLAIEYLLPEDMLGPAKLLEIRFPSGGLKLAFEADFVFIHAHYRSLLNTTKVLHRADIYGSGLPNTALHEDILGLAEGIQGPVLDFGCGRGVLVRHLLDKGADAYGLEMDTEIIRTSIPPEIRDRITLYDGSFPAPYGDASFRSVICSEVLEHIPDYRTAIAEMARMATQTVVLTVPDASAIPVGFRHGLVPWHLLESTHFNFFTQQSLKAALEPHFSSLEFGRIGPCCANDSTFYVSLAVVCSK